MTDLREASDLSTGSILGGRYRLEARIGEGGMARVFRAEDAALRRTVAIKVLRGHVDEVGSVARTLSETTLLASLSHHSLVTLFDAHVSEDDPSYLVMEYVEGITMRDLIADGPVDAAQMASIAVDIAEGLHIAHSAGVVHRDIKPSNVLLWESPLPGLRWRAKLADFGIAYLLDSPRMTSPGIAVGTVAYIAPEQARGETPAPPADIYAFGIMLIEALTGTRPFADAEGIGTVMARLSSPPTIPETLHPAWQGLLRGMTSTQPQDRPTALEVAVAARRLAENDDAAIQPADQPTMAMTPPTDRTAILPAASAAPGAAATMAVPAAEDPVTPRATSPMAAAMVALSEHPSGPLPLGRSAASRAQRARRRRAAVGVAIALVALLIAIAAGAWLLSLAGQPSPEPTMPVVIQPSEEPANAPVEQEPAPVDQGGGDTDNSGPGSGGGGNGNGNRGPGNNNGGGNGNGNGNGNRGPGNNNGND
ncbi:serine/threonine-protein kinase [Microbacterium sp. NPDC056003]|uniref:serine/threonine-protein kinase n=1 Tax=Microbacterium sp. NPDC056003 TaxID=3345676 RepID=UPI0035DB2F19